mmetsp:Transcript_60515/g.132478  ORF Transcript_60515/g.132478 Transcript_60515/m.132478 type:complete len:204 (-) Transcript_60515:61-672(-)
MSKLREILLARAKEPAKIHPIERHEEVPECSLPPVRPNRQQNAPSYRRRNDKVNRQPEVTQLPRLVPSEHVVPPPAQPAPVRRGKVPAYIKRRQAELAEQRRLASMPQKPQAPAGYRLVEDEERRMTVDALQQRKVEVERALNALPFKIETPGQHRREKDLLNSLAQVEKLQKMFTNPTVFVPEDAGPIFGNLPPVAQPKAHR